MLLTDTSSGKLIMTANQRKEKIPLGANKNSE